MYRPFYQVVDLPLDNQSYATAQHFVFMNRFLIAEHAAAEAQKLGEAAYVPIALTEQLIAAGQEQGQFRAADSQARALCFWSAVNGLCVNVE